MPGAILYLFAENVFDSDGGPGVCEPASWYRRVHPAVLRRIEAYRVYCVFRMLTGDVRHHNSIISTLGTGWATSEAEVASLDSCSWTHCDTRKPGSLRVLAGRILEQGPGPAWPHRAQERVGAPDLELLRAGRTAANEASTLLRRKNRYPDLFCSAVTPSPLHPFTPSPLSPLHLFTTSLLHPLQPVTSSPRSPLSPVTASNPSPRLLQSLVLQSLRCKSFCV